MAQILKKDQINSLVDQVKPNLVPQKHCNDSVSVQHLKNGSLFVRASDLTFEGNWKKHGTYSELLDSNTFKVSGSCVLEGDDPYVGHFVIGLRRQHTMGKVKIESSPPKEESEEDLTNHTPELMIPLALGFCEDDNVEFSLTSAEPLEKLPLQKGLIVYGVTFTPVEM